MMDPSARERLDALVSKGIAYQQRYEFIDDLKWPDGARIAVNFTADFDAMLYRRILNEPALQLAKGEFGGRVGIWRLIELFDSHDIKATIFTPGRICELYPQALRRAVASGHELADHMWEHRVPREAALEADHLQKALTALSAIRGKPISGSRSGHTNSLLKQSGIVYNSHAPAGHLPYYIADRAGKNTLLNLPFHYAIDDAQFYTFGWLGSESPAQRMSDPDRVLEMWWAAFLQQYNKGGYLNVCLHPYVSGRALRIEMLDQFIRRMKKLPGVWFSTCEETATYCLKHFPARRLTS
jgi:peptidoglycan/xylan/chitin deacetylase (PgdA/CDA1 family)